MPTRTKMCAIAPQVKRAVRERDKGLCIFCGRPGDPVAHVISRAHGGLGVEQNIITACFECHRRMDQTTNRKWMVQKAKEYLKGFYPDWTEDKVTFDKWRDLK